jgi:hypothetical protein
MCLPHGGLCPLQATLRGRRCSGSSRSADLSGARGDEVGDVDLLVIMEGSSSSPMARGQSVAHANGEASPTGHPRIPWCQVFAASMPVRLTAVSG